MDFRRGEQEGVPSLSDSTGAATVVGRSFESVAGSFATLHGYDDPAALVGGHVTAPYVESDHDALEQALGETFAGEGSETRTVRVRLRKDGGSKLGETGDAGGQDAVVQLTFYRTGLDTAAIVARPASAWQAPGPATANEVSGAGRGGYGRGRNEWSYTVGHDQLARRREELATLDHIGALLSTIVSELGQTGTRRDIEAIACESLVESSRYRFAWVGTRRAGAMHVRACAGEDAGVLESVATADSVELGDVMCERVYDTGTSQVAHDIAADTSCGLWSEAAGGADIRSALATPLCHGGSVYGVLTVYSGEPDAFTPREQAWFELLGETVGFAINATESKRLLYADAVVELEFRITDSDVFLVRDSARFECALSIEGYHITRSGSWLVYVSSSGVDSGRLREAGLEESNVESVRIIRDDPGDGLLEYALERSELFELLAEAGAMLCRTEAIDGVCRFVLEASADIDVRALASRVTSVLSGGELISQHERDRAVADHLDLGAPLDGLTDRQREAIETAYRAGYFDWPRQSTAEEVAASIGIAPSTLHAHLRKAERSVLRAILDER
ncbi:bacterio-opsin activator domain-containing protein [Haloarchaeobius sp. HME9146]|uniref:bacterio-opsin activator domain-containing protein n=1 Tax=Haloarchaeobius sp. HME9146 TaxID=2978732 RepID=UPI0021BE16A9|nr:bacterio-opsin activator domain-containing protein [Haloarchaeobius sp. HME9146]MCT9098238.1 helix-turn-helix domain-containing protein [Haloarchaeobius sp. HME9146]